MKGTSKLRPPHLSADRPLQRLRGCFLGDNAALPPAYRVKVENAHRAPRLFITLCVVDGDSFDSLDYIQHRFGDLHDQRATYVLGQLHGVLSGYVRNKRSGCELKVLDFGSGPVVQNSINAAAFACEVVFSDISSANRKAIQKWLDGDADAFNWSPHFGKRREGGKRERAENEKDLKSRFL